MRLFRKRHGFQGFTLLEIMVAIFLLSFVIAAVYSSWMAVMKGSRSGLKAAAEVQRSRIAIRTIEDALTCTRMFVADADNYGFEAENGNKAYVSFVAKLPQSFPRGGKFGDYTTRRVTFSLEESGLESQLVLRQSPMLMEMDEDEKNHPVVLAKNVKRLELGFWDTKKGEWLDEWTQTNQLPAMVKVTLEFGEKNSFQSKPQQELVRTIAIPALAVQTVWQRPPR
jgi:type II secretion system protein J